MSNTEPIYEYDTNGKLIHYRSSNGFETWYEYDTNGKLIHGRNSVGLEYWCEYDTNGDQIHYWDSHGEEAWWEYDTEGKCTHYRENNGYESWYDSEGNEYHTQEEAIRANSRINLNNLINRMSFEDLVMLENLIKDKFIQQYIEDSERIRKEQ